MGKIRILLGIAVAVAIGWALKAGGWPSHTYVPAALLAGLSTSLIWVFAWYLARKLTYPRNAQSRRQLLAEERRETMAAAAGDGRDSTEQGVCSDGE